MKIIKECSTNTNQKNPIVVEKTSKIFPSLRAIRYNLGLDMVDIVKELGFKDPSIILEMELEERFSNK
jgi:hypothetical protein